MDKDLNKILNSAKKIRPKESITDLNEIKPGFDSHKYAKFENYADRKSSSTKYFALSAISVAALSLFFLNSPNPSINNQKTENISSINRSANVIPDAQKTNPIKEESPDNNTKKTYKHASHITLEKNNEANDIATLRKVEEMSSVELNSKDLKRLGVYVGSLGAYFQIEESVVLSKLDAKQKEVFNTAGYFGDSAPVLAKYVCSYDSKMNKILLPFDGDTPDRCSRISPLIVEYYQGEKREQFYTHTPLLNYGCDAAFTEFYELTSGHYKDCELIDKYGTLDAAKMRKNGLANEIYTKKLIPIKIDLQKFGGAPGAVCVMWYAATQDLLDVLPSEVSYGLSKEITLVGMPGSSNFDRNDACKGLKDKSILDICRTQSGAIESAQLYPNPCENFTKLSITTGVSRKSIIVTLHDLTGRLIRQLASSEANEAGVTTLDLNLSSDASGAYLVAIHTETGEQVVVKAFKK